MMTGEQVRSGESRKVLTFQTSKQEYCIDVTSIREIRGWAPATPLPHAPAYVRGVINLRGIVLPIVDFASCLGQAPLEPTARSAIIVVELGNKLIGILVDGVTEILDLQSQDVQPTPDIASSIAKSYISGVAPVNGRMISLVCLDPVVGHVEQAH